MKYTHRFTIPAPQPVVAAFHRRSGSLVAITPPTIALLEVSMLETHQRWGVANFSNLNIGAKPSLTMLIKPDAMHVITKEPETA